MTDKAKKEIQATLKKLRLEMGYEFSFPKYRQLPDEVLLALKVLGKHEMKVIFTLVPRQKQSK